MFSGSSLFNLEDILKKLLSSQNCKYHLLQPCPVEQGGALQRSSLPQQVFPPLDSANVPLLGTKPADKILEIRLLPHWRHITFGLSFVIFSRNSEIEPHCSHRYS